MKKLIVSVLFITNLFSVNILILNSYSPLIEWTAIQTHTLIKKFQTDNNIDLYIEYMNTKKFRPTPKRYKNYLSYLKNKYENIKFDIIITTDDNALNFVREYKNETIFKKAKVFFEGVNNLNLKNILDKNIYTGVFEKKEPLSNLNIAKKINPNLKTIYIVSDSSTSGNKTIQQYKKVFEKIKGIKFIYINSKNLNDIIKALQYYDKNSVMMLLTFASMFYNKNFILPKKVPQLLSKYYHNPMIIHTNTYANIPNTNIIGGDCTDAAQQATLNAKKVITYLNNKNFNELNFTLTGANKIYLNVKNLEKFKVNVNSLNIKNPTLVNEPTSFYEIYKTEIITFITIIAVIIFFIIILTKKNKELLSYSKKLDELNKNLESKIKKAIEKNRKQEQIMFQQSKLAAMGEMIGAIAHQWRQPLNSLALNIQLFVDDFFDNKVDKKYVEDFEKKNLNIINFMSKTIDDFRNFFNKDKTKEEFILKDAITDVVKLIDKQLKNHNIEISITGNNKKVFNYKNELKQVILNIINNAKDAIIENNIQNGKISISIENNKIIIEDNAGGIPKEIEDRIFEPYFTTKDTKGTGIGLYMSKIIIEDHMNGKLYFENTQNGVKFIIELKENIHDN